MTQHDPGRSARREGRARALLPLLALGSALLLAACEAAPIGDLELARSALDQARSAGAEAWATDEYAHARALFDDAVLEMSSQAARWSAFRSYGRARQILAAARADALGARDNALREKERARREASETLRRTRAALDGARAAVRVAPSPRDGRAQAARLRSELDSVEAELPGVERLIGAEDYAAATSRSEDLAARVQRALSRFFAGIEEQANGSRRGSSRRRASLPGTCRGASPALPCGGRLGHQEATT